MAGGIPAPVDTRTIYANWLSQHTGLDARVILAQMQAEGHPGDEAGYNNWLNIEGSTAGYYNIPHGTGLAGIAEFSTVQASEQAAYDTYKGLGLTNEKGKSIAQQIADIGNSGWASSHYGNPPGANLLADFKNMFPKVNVGSVAAGTTPATTGSSSGGGSSGGGLGSIFGNPFSGAFSGITAMLYQITFILVGLGLVIVGLFLIARAIMAVGAPGTIQAIERVSAIRQGQVRTQQAGRRVAATEASGERTQQRIAIQARRQKLAEQKEARLQSMT